MQDAGRRPAPINARAETLLERPMFRGFAGLYAESDDGITCAIITTAANDLVGTVHDRMPVILHPDDEGTWLDTSATSPADVLPLLTP